MADYLERLDNENHWMKCWRRKQRKPSSISMASTWGWSSAGRTSIFQIEFFCVHVPFGWINNVMYYTMEMPLVELDHVTTLMAGPFALISRGCTRYKHKNYYTWQAPGPNITHPSSKNFRQGISRLCQIARKSSIICLYRRPSLVSGY